MAVNRDFLDGEICSDLNKVHTSLSSPYPVELAPEALQQHLTAASVVDYELIKKLAKEFDLWEAEIMAIARGQKVPDSEQRLELLETLYLMI